jgi:hypothetical protein
LSLFNSKGFISKDKEAEAEAEQLLKKKSSY